ncbi:MAG: HIT family protein [Bacilli bacterium]
MNCIFCEIVNGNIQSHTIYENDFVKVFLDVNPKSNGHSLIIPKKHFKDLDDIDEMTLNNILKTSKKVKLLLEDKLNIKGCSLVQNNGDLQEVKHFHLHIIPSYSEEMLSINDVYKKIKD